MEPDFSHCFQLMECAEARLLQKRILTGRVPGTTFEMVPVVSSKEIRDVVAPLLDGS